VTNGRTTLAPGRGPAPRPGSFCACTLTAALAIAGCGAAESSPETHPSDGAGGAPELIVRYEPGISASEQAEVRADVGARLVRRSTLPRTELVQPRRGQSPADAIRAFEASPAVEYAELNSTVEKQGPGQ